MNLKGFNCASMDVQKMNLKWTKNVSDSKMDLNGTLDEALLSK